MDEEKSTRIRLTLRPSLVQALDELADAFSLDVTQTATFALALGVRALRPIAQLPLLPPAVQSAMDDVANQEAQNVFADAGVSPRN